MQHLSSSLRRPGRTEGAFGYTQFGSGTLQVRGLWQGLCKSSTDFLLLSL